MPVPKPYGAFKEPPKSAIWTLACHKSNMGMILGRLGLGVDGKLCTMLLQGEKVISNTMANSALSRTSAGVWPRFEHAQCL